MGWINAVLISVVIFFIIGFIFSCSIIKSSKEEVNSIQSDTKDRIENSDKDYR